MTQTRDSSSLVAQWDIALNQLDSHRRGCACDPCSTARDFLDRMRDLLTEIFGD